MVDWLKASLYAVIRPCKLLFFYIYEFDEFVTVGQTNSWYALTNKFAMRDLIKEYK